MKAASPTLGAPNVPDEESAREADLLAVLPARSANREVKVGAFVLLGFVAFLISLFTLTDVLVTDYSSSIFEFALLHRPLVLLVPDLAEYERDPGLYLDFRREMIGAQVADTAGVIAAVSAGVVDRAAYDSFIARHLGAADGRASERFVEHFLG